MRKLLGQGNHGIKKGIKYATHYDYDKAGIWFM